MENMLIAFDGSECSFRAVDFAGRHFSCLPDLRIVLLHVIPYPPAPLWDDGHIPGPEEKEVRERLLNQWLTDQKTKFEELFRRAIKILTDAGMSPDRIEIKSISDSVDVAESVLEEARDGGYRTLVMGRRGLSRAKRIFTGSVTSKIIGQGAGITVCVVE
jgi:nucleotide-binding universal stress UspA family protein